VGSTPPGSTGVRHHFTVDVEEYFQVAAMEPYVRRSDWDGIDSRVDIGTRLVMKLLAEAGAQGTFFTLGWVAKKNPALVRAIVDNGHELASHGWGHERVTTLSPAQFRESVRDSKKILEDVGGQRIRGYRAPSFSIIRGGEWALDILIEERYEYDSSLFPIFRSGYGYAGGQARPHVLHRPAGTLAEFPPATVGAGKLLVPAGGGAYFRLLPYRLTSMAFASAEGQKYPATFYIHPWELDPEQPRLPVNWKTRVRHYGGLRRTVPRLRRLLSQFRFQSIAATLDADILRLQAQPRAS
jgi:polysaccharide deacetylase family protein (PEP-CTERM system associated)